MQDGKSMRSDARDWNWVDGRVLLVTPVRCLGCAAIATRRRTLEHRYRKHEPTPGTYAPLDGVRYRAEVINGEAVTQ